MSEENGKKKTQMKMNTRGPLAKSFFMQDQEPNAPRPARASRQYPTLGNSLGNNGLPRMRNAPLVHCPRAELRILVDVDYQSRAGDG